ncbi:hypothetical protein [Pseudanabaena sp. Chao 1811]|uniref:hypothetical protein n=1 Tax=Pseudanabaena sp. Chao 1811 TaxID=2963092 RepID=UPI0022F3FF76|nr:hypothetical protein [Pseudanabaena sp. Chao 1811]
MAFELDHIFICTDINAWEADRLVAFGFIEGSANVHLGQGTANRRFFFHNAMIEMLWVHNSEETKSESIRRTHLGERWENRKGTACPFGICLRSVTASNGTVPFSHWAYHPPYLPETMSIAVGTNSHLLNEPMLFQIPFGKRPDQYPPEKAQPIEHSHGLREITRLAMVSPTANNISPEFQAVIDSNILNIREGKNYCIEIGFDGEIQGNQLDCRPELPMILFW